MTCKELAKKADRKAEPRFFFTGLVFSARCRNYMDRYRAGHGNSSTNMWAGYVACDWDYCVALLVVMLIILVEIFGRLSKCVVMQDEKEV